MQQHAAAFLCTPHLNNGASQAPSTGKEAGLGTEAAGPLREGGKKGPTGRSVWKLGLKLNTRKHLSQKCLNTGCLPGKGEHSPSWEVCKSGEVGRDVKAWLTRVRKDRTAL